MIAINIALVIFFLLMNAYFVVAEFSLVKVRPSQVEVLVQEKKPGAKYTQIIASNVNAYLSACQLGITLASLALGWLGEPAISTLLYPLLEHFHLSAATVSAIAVAVGFFVITTLHIIIGELIPKSLAIFSTEKFALLSAPGLVFFYRITYPVMWLFNSVTNGVMRLLGHTPSEQHQVYSEDEIKLLLEESSKEGVLAETQYRYMDNIFDLEDKDAEALMTPRTDMICFYAEDSLAECIDVAKEHMFTRYPICSEDKDHIIGFVHIKDLFTLRENATLEDLKVRTLNAIPETMPVDKILRIFQKKKTKIALVVDEHGGTAGIVTLSDIFSQIVGKLDDEYIHDETEVEELGKDHYLIDGALSIDVFADMAEIEIDDMLEYETLGGFLLELFDRVPKENDTVVYEQIRFTVRKMEGHRIVTVEVEREQPSPDDEEAEDE